MKTLIYHFCAADSYDDSLAIAYVIPNSEKTVTEAMELGRRVLACSSHPNMRFALQDPNGVHISLESVQEVATPAADLIAADKVLFTVTGARHFVAESELTELEALAELHAVEMAEAEDDGLFDEADLLAIEAQLS